MVWVMVCVLPASSRPEGFQQPSCNLRLAGEDVMECLGEVSGPEEDPDWQPGEEEAAADDEDVAQEEELLMELEDEVEELEEWVDQEGDTDGDEISF